MSIYNKLFDTSQVVRYYDMLPQGSLQYTWNDLNEKGYTGNGDWLFNPIPRPPVIMGNSDIFQLPNPDKSKTYIFRIVYDQYGTKDKPITVRLRTNTLALETLKNVKSLISLNVAYDFGGNIQPILRVSARQNYGDPDNWTEIPATVNPEGYLQYWLRRAGEYKYITFELEYTNDGENYISRLKAVSLTVKIVKTKER